jgi:hypothetical protein
MNAASAGVPHGVEIGASSTRYVRERGARVQRGAIDLTREPEAAMLVVGQVVEGGAAAS